MPVNVYQTVQKVVVTSPDNTVTVTPVVTKVVVSGGGGIINSGAAPSYLHTQASASSTWTINHNLGFKPAVEILSVGGVEIEATVTHVSVNQVVISFTTATAGSARLN